MIGPLPRRVTLVGDALQRLQGLPSASIDAVLTSPPYFRLRDYGIGDQLGGERHVDAWVTRLRLVMGELARVLVPTGSLWLNLGDSYATRPDQGAARKSLLLGPERLALALVEDGWLLRNKVVWQKSNPMPISATDRLSCTWEIVYVLTRSPRYFFDLDSARVPHTSHANPRRTPSSQADLGRGPNAAGTSGLSHLKTLGISGHPLGKNPGDVWRLASSAYRGAAHPAMFPVALAEQAIRSGCPQRRCTQCRLPHRRKLLRAIGGTALRGQLSPSCDCDAPSEPGLVLDPFMGSGSTAVAAERLQRDWLGIELNPAFVALAERRLQEARAGPRFAP